MAQIQGRRGRGGYKKGSRSPLAASHKAVPSPPPQARPPKMYPSTPELLAVPPLATANPPAFTLLSSPELTAAKDPRDDFENLRELLEGDGSPIRTGTSADIRAAVRTSERTPRTQSSGSLASLGDGRKVSKQKKKLHRAKHSKEDMSRDPAGDMADVLWQEAAREFEEPSWVAASDGPTLLLPPRSDVYSALVEYGKEEREQLPSQLSDAELEEPRSSLADQHIESFEDHASSFFLPAEVCFHVEQDPDDGLPPMRRRLLADIKAHASCPNGTGGAVAAFRAALAEGEQPLRAIKLCFIGHARAGKTSTLKALAGRDFDCKEQSTHGVETCRLARTELLHGPNTASSPWCSMDASETVSEFWETGVAETVVQRLLDSSGVASTLPRTSDNAAVDTSPSVGDFATDELKMPWDLLARAVREGDSSNGERAIDGNEVSCSGTGATNNPTPADKQVVMQTWDFAGQVMYYSMAHVFLTAFGVYVLVLDLSLWIPTDNVDAGREVSPGEARDALDFWLAAVLVHAPNARLIIVGSHDDAVPEAVRPEVHKRVDEHLATRLARMPSLHSQLRVNQAEQLLFFPVDNRRTTLSSRRSVDTLRETLNEVVLQVAEELGSIPTRWAHFYHVLSTGGRAAHVGLAECRNLAEPFGILSKDEEMESFLALFHSLGQLLHFPGSPAVVLDPQWLLDAMAQVVGCPRVLQQHPQSAAALKAKGELSSELLEFLWRDPRFSGHTATLRAFLEHFDMLVPGSEGSWIVPSLLKSREETFAGKACRAGSATFAQPSAMLFLDFHGALREMLPSLLPRLLCHLRRLEGSRLRVYNVFRDTMTFAFGVPSVVVALEPWPALTSPEMIRVKMSAPAGRSVEYTAVKSILAAIEDALRTKYPGVTFSAKVLCPGCCADRSLTQTEVVEASAHLLDLEEVLREDLLFCDEAQVLVDSEELQDFAKSWRQATLSTTADTEREPTACSDVRLRYFYASPLVSYARPLDVPSEVRALHSVANMHVDVRVGTAESIREALLDCGGVAHAMLHISAHCIRSSTNGMPMLLLEDECSSPHAIGMDEISRLGPWSNVYLLVFLSCGSVELVRSLMASQGSNGGDGKLNAPAHAICCHGEVFDAAAKLFCRVFYHALSAGESIAACHQSARDAVAVCADPGLQCEADKFLLKARNTGDSHPAPSPVVAPATQKTKRPASTTWGPWARVDDYVGRIDETLLVAKCFIQNGRRAILLCGDPGIGKTAFCREFCHHYVASGGRYFSSGAYLVDCARVAAQRRTDSEAVDELLAKAILAELQPDQNSTASTASMQGAIGDTRVLGTPPFTNSVSSACAAVCDAVRGRDASTRDHTNGHWLLVVDGLDHLQRLSAQLPATTGGSGLEIAAQLLRQLLESTTRLCLLMTSRCLVNGCFTELGTMKVVDHKLTLLAPRHAALLFLRRVRRPLHSDDFAVDTQYAASAPSVCTTKESDACSSHSTAAIGRGSHVPAPGTTLTVSRLLDKLSAHALLRLAAGVPARITALAAAVDDSLPSLLQHPALRDGNSQLA